MAWLLLILGLVGSLAGNVAAASTDAGRVGAAFPPLLLLLGVEVLTGLTRPTKTPRPEADTSRIAEPGPAELGDRAPRWGQDRGRMWLV